MHYQETPQSSSKWKLASQNELNCLRFAANKRAREWLAQSHHEASTSEAGAETTSSPSQSLLDVTCFASNHQQDTTTIHDESSPLYGPTQSSHNHPLLNSSEESTLLSFYASKIPALIGPHATHPRCIRQPKVAATASLLFRRFYLSNSVLIFDPKALSVASAFLAAKIEDCMLDVRYLELATKEMNAPVTMEEILKAEIELLRGVDYDLVMWHPYKTVLAVTEDLRVYLKSERGKRYATVVLDEKEERERLVSGEDLRPMHDAAMKICDDVIVSDIPLLYGPGEVGLAALMVANDDIICSNKDEMSSLIENNGEETAPPSSSSPKRQNTKIDIIGYIQSRFQDSSLSNNEQVKIDSDAIDTIVARVTSLTDKIRELREGKHGCGNYNVDMEVLKGVHKKLKKCRAWGQSSGEKKKKKKRKAEET
jgi:cyclin H